LQLFNEVDSNVNVLGELSSRRYLGYRTGVGRLVAGELGRWQRLLGLPFIVKTDRSCAGSGCFRVGSLSDYEVVVSAHGGTVVTFSEMLPGPTYNGSGLIRRNGDVLAGATSLQLTGVPALTANPLGYCGNAFGVVAPAIAERVEGLVHLVGGWLGAKHYRGMFGIDVVVDGDRAELVDINPRLQGSTLLLSETSVGARLIEEHLRSFVTLPGEVGRTAGADGEDARAEMTAPAAQGFVRNLAAEAWQRTHRGPANGIYGISGGRLRFERPGFDVEDADQEIVVRDLPSRQVRVAPGAQICRIMAFGANAKAIASGTWRWDEVVRGVEALGTFGGAMMESV
jgi:hypothetical protein